MSNRITANAMTSPMMALVPGARLWCACTVVVRNQLPGSLRRCRSTLGMSTPNVVVPDGTVTPEVPTNGREDTSETEEFSGKPYLAASTR